MWVGQSRCAQRYPRFAVAVSLTLAERAGRCAWRRRRQWRRRGWALSIRASSTPSALLPLLWRREHNGHVVAVLEPRLGPADLDMAECSPLPGQRRRRKQVGHRFNEEAQLSVTGRCRSRRARRSPISPHSVARSASANRAAIPISISRPGFRQIPGIGTPMTRQPPAVRLARPICVYPVIARYSGSGDPNDAASFVCQGVAPAGR